MHCAMQRAAAVPPLGCPSQVASCHLSSRAGLPPSPAPCRRGWDADARGGQASRSHRPLAAAAAATDSQGRGGEALSQSNYRWGMGQPLECTAPIHGTLAMCGKDAAIPCSVVCSCRHEASPSALSPPLLPHTVSNTASLFHPLRSLFVRFLHMASPYVAGHRGRTFVITIPGEVGPACSGKCCLQRQAVAGWGPRRPALSSHHHHHHGGSLAGLALRAWARFGKPSGSLHTFCPVAGGGAQGAAVPNARGCAACCLAEQRRFS